VFGHHFLGHKVNFVLDLMMLRILYDEKIGEIFVDCIKEITPCPWNSPVQYVNYRKLLNSAINGMVWYGMVWYGIVEFNVPLNTV